jgi:hypothetical protein
MTIRVDLTELTATLADFDYAYLLTVNDEGRAHAVAVTPDLTDGAFRVHELGRKSVANAAARPQLSLVYPPRDPGGYSLIVDGDATADGDTVSITPTTAVLHRPAPAGFQPDAGACGSDCQPITLGNS